MQLPPLIGDAATTSSADVESKISTMSSAGDESEVSSSSDYENKSLSSKCEIPRSMVSVGMGFQLMWLFYSHTGYKYIQVIYRVRIYTELNLVVCQNVEDTSNGFHNGEL